MDYSDEEIEAAARAYDPLWWDYYDSLGITGKAMARAEVVRRLGALRAALSALPPRAPGGWRDIESAPRDGTYVLVWDATPHHPKGGRPVVAFWLGNGWHEWGPGRATYATHWQPLPSPPGMIPPHPLEGK